MNFIELRDKVVKIKREIEDMDRFEEEEMKKIRPVKNTLYVWLVNYIPQTYKKKNCFKNVLKLFYKSFRANAPKQTVYGRGHKLSKPRKQNTKKPFISEENKKIKDIIICDTWKLFETKEEKKERKKQTQNKRLIKDTIIRDIRTLFE